MNAHSNPQIARRYAEALFSVLSRDEHDTVLKQFNRLLIVLADPKIKRVFFHPRTLPQRKYELIRLMQLAKPLEHFLFLTVEKSREPFLTQIHNEFERLVLAAQGTSKAQVITAVPLRAEKARELKERLERRSGKKVLLEQVVDAKIGGGLIVKMDGEMIDGSLTNILNRLRKNILEKTAARI